MYVRTVIELTKHLLCICIVLICRIAQILPVMHLNKTRMLV